MIAATPPTRRLAARIVAHAARILAVVDLRWAAAMRHELAHIDDDGDALRWAIGCLVAGYAVRLKSRLRISAWRMAASSAIVVLVIGLALEAHARDEPPHPVPNTGCASDNSPPTTSSATRVTADCPPQMALDHAR